MYVCVYFTYFIPIQFLFPFKNEKSTLSYNDQSGDKDQAEYSLF